MRVWTGFIWLRFRGGLLWTLKLYKRRGMSWPAKKDQLAGCDVERLWFGDVASGL